MHRPVPAQDHYNGIYIGGWRLDEGLKPDITIRVRMDESNERIHDYYLLPGIDMTVGKTTVSRTTVFIWMHAFRLKVCSISSLGWSNALKSRRPHE